MYGTSNVMLLAASSTGGWVPTGSDGKLWIKVTGTGTAQITKIPQGVTYTVTEKEIPEGWVQDGEPVYSDSSHTIGNDTDTVTVNNTKDMSLNVTKQWTKDNVARTDKQSIGFTLYQKLTPTTSGSGTSEKNSVYSAYNGTGVGTVTYNAETNSWNTVTISNLPLTVTKDVTVDGTTTQVTYNASYYVEETPEAAEAGYILATTYSTSTQGSGTNAVSSGKDAAVNTDGATITIINTETPGVILPSTGDPGTTIYTATGAALALLAALWLLLRKRRENT